MRSTLVALLLITACGPGVAGRYSGVLLLNRSCSSGPAYATSSRPVSWDVSGNGVVSLTPTGADNCGTLKADVDAAGAAADVRQIICTPTTLDGQIDHQTISGGHLAFRSTAVVVSLKFIEVIGDTSPVVQCNSVAEGTLGRE